MKPFKIFLFILCTVLIGSVIIYWEDISHFNFFDFIRVNDTETTADNPLADSLVATVVVPLDVDTAIAPVVEEEKHVDVSAMDFPYDTITDGLRMYNPSQLKDLAHKIHQADIQGEDVRILYLGDSQLEGDFLVSTLRSSLQDKYGGKGPGLIAADTYYSSEHKLVATVSENWTQSARMKIKKGNRSIVFRNASISAQSGKAWVKINRLNFSKDKEDYNQLRIFLNNQDSLTVKIYSSKQLLATYRLGSSNALNSIDYSFDSTPKQLELVFETEGKLELEAISLDSKSGIHVDNIPLRGKAYPLFSTSDDQAMSLCLKQLKPSLVILQYGANVVKYVDQNNIGIFKSNTVEQIKLIKEWCPQAEILLVSTSDIAHKTARGVEAYAATKILKACQYEIAMQNGCVFWDLDHYMRKEGGVADWARRKPALARQDYIHFTKYGARKVGGELSRLLIEEFDNN